MRSALVWAGSLQEEGFSSDNCIFAPIPLDRLNPAAYASLMIYRKNHVVSKL